MHSRRTPRFCGAQALLVSAACIFPGVADAQLQGTVQSPVTITGSAGTPINFSVYLPPGYVQNGNERYPVVYHLHGLGGSHIGGGGAGGGSGHLNVVPSGHEEAVTLGLVEPVIIVFPDGYGDSWWADSFDGSKPAESDMMTAIIPYVDSQFRTQANRGHRIIQGFSMGGFGAAKFGAKFPDTFGASLIYDGALLDWGLMQSRHPTLASSIFNDDALYFEEYAPWSWVTENAAVLQTDVPFRQAVGLLTAWNESFRSHLLNNGVTPSFIDTPAAHNLLEVLGSSEGTSTVSRASWSFIQEVFDANSVAVETFASIAAEDGWISESSETSSLGGTLNSNGSNLLVGDNAQRQQLRSVLSFDTSAIPDDATILSARITLSRTAGAGAPTATLGTLRADVRSGSFGLPALQSADFQAVATAAPGVDSVSVPSPGSSTSADLNGNGLLAVNRSGRTQLRLGFSVGDDNDSTADNVAFASANHPNVGLRPVLEIIYEQN